MPDFTAPYVLTILAELIAKESDLPVEALGPQMSFIDDLGIDSVTMINIVLQAQEHFGVEISDDTVYSWETVQEAVDFITKNASAPADEQAF